MLQNTLKIDCKPVVVVCLVSADFRLIRTAVNKQ